MFSNILFSNMFSNVFSTEVYNVSVNVFSNVSLLFTLMDPSPMCYGDPISKREIVTL